MPDDEPHRLLWLLQRGLIAVAAVAATVALFLVLPLMQTISSPPERDLVVRDVGVTELEAPPPPPPPEELEEPEPPNEPPRLELQAAPLDLSQLELALDPGFGDGLLGDFEVQLIDPIASGDGDELDDVFSLGELDQRPRPIFQRPPRYPADLRRRDRKGTVTVLFLVDTRGRVIDPKVEASTDAAFNRAALDAIRQWRFEPGVRDGEKVSFKMRIPITFDG